MKACRRSVVIGVAACLLVQSVDVAEAGRAVQDKRPRVIVMTDGECDDRASMVRFLLNTCHVDLEAIVQTNSRFQKNGHSAERWIEDQIDAYEKVYPNLIKHDGLYPHPDTVRARIVVGDEDYEHMRTIKTWDQKPGHKVEYFPDDWPDTPGSDRIVDVLLSDDPRPVHIQAWGGANTLSRALFVLKNRHPQDYERAIAKARFYTIWYQDDAGNYIERHHPGLMLIWCDGFSTTWTVGAHDRAFFERNVTNGHGPLGAKMPLGCGEGDTPAQLWALDNGLRNHEDPTFGGWGGRFVPHPDLPNVYVDIHDGDHGQAIRRWMVQVNHDFIAKLDWCVAERFEDANHKPVIHIRGGVGDRTVRAGKTLTLDARKTKDPDGDRVRLRWWQYREAGTLDETVALNELPDGRVQLVAPQVDRRATLHLILEVQDDGTPTLTAFQRIIVHVLP